MASDKKPEEVLVVAFVDKTIGYTGADFLGLDRINYPFEVRIVGIPSTAMLSKKHVMYAFAVGADGVIVLEGKKEIGEHYTRGLMDEIADALDEMGIESMRLWFSVVELPAYKKMAAIFREQTDLIKELGPIPEDVREELKKSLGIQILK